jgi:hypothetical protein
MDAARSSRDPADAPPWSRRRVVPHLLLRRIEVELALERGDRHCDVAAAAAVMAVRRLGAARARCAMTARPPRPRRRAANDCFMCILLLVG